MKSERKKKNETASVPQEENRIAGRNPVLEALKSGTPLDTIYLSNRQGVLGQIAALATEKGILVKTVSDAKLSQMTQQTHQGVVAEGACAQYATIAEILEVAAAKGQKPLLLICDEIQDPHNLGAILRTAEAAGFHGVILPKRRSASLNATVAKTSAGAVSWIKVARVPNLVAAMEELKQNGVWIYGTDAAGTDYTQSDFTGGTAFVIGSEGEGIGRLVREHCDQLLSLPMYGHVNSLNASVAAGIFVYEAVRQRRNTSGNL
jgi:23S rRNA (guanosine2251-2'-O)-methyltransferase